MHRYARINEKFPREFVLLQGTGCRWRRCTFCDYHTDTDRDPFAVNEAVLAQVTGCYGVLDVINSGSAMELDSNTLTMLRTLVREKQIHTLWFEAHYLYRHQLAAFAAQFAPASVKFRCGVESFDPRQRLRWNKGIAPTVTAEAIASYFQGVCLLCCTQGETKERILADIATAKAHFEYISVNLFCNNTTSVKRDEALARWFHEEVYPRIREDAHIEILLE
ncbi:MAG: hypothetical protein IJ502_01235, partial [Alistipes sp.]|nr:hypothetical protein [Alistipes sp.]